MTPLILVTWFVAHLSYTFAVWIVVYDVMVLNRFHVSIIRLMITCLIIAVTYLIRGFNPSWIGLYGIFAIVCGLLWYLPDPEKL